MRWLSSQAADDNEVGVADGTTQRAVENRTTQWARKQDGFRRRRAENWWWDAVWGGKVGVPF